MRFRQSGWPAFAESSFLGEQRRLAAGRWAGLHDGIAHLGMTASVAVGEHRYGKCKYQQHEHSAHGHVHVAIGVNQINHQLNDVVAQGYPKCERADSKEAAEQNKLIRID